jgi:asparagine synthase (glutamine-hydrolysing)
VFHTKSDTEVIVHAWESWGADCVKRFRGMFAFALWDRNRQTFFMARDRLGVKPMFYALLDDGTVAVRLGTEVCDRPGRGCGATWIPLPWRSTLRLATWPSRAPSFGRPGSCSPGHSLMVRHGQPLPEPVAYWDVRFTLNNPMSLEDAQGELVERLRESVRLRMIAEVPLGAFLSGGVDSSAVVA